MSGHFGFKNEKQKKSKAENQVENELSAQHRYHLRGLNGQYMHLNDLLRDILNGKLKLVMNWKCLESKSELEEWEDKFDFQTKFGEIWAEFMKREEESQDVKDLLEFERLKKKFSPIKRIDGDVLNKKD